MDDLQDRLARVGLGALAGYGFALAGGYALQAHQLVDRMSEDIDMFTDRWDATEFSRAIDALSEAYRAEGLEVSVTRRAETFARLQVTSGRKVATIDLAADVRRLEPVGLSVGPVLAERDAIASKVAAVFSRGEAHDYLDLTGIRLGAESDAGFSKGWFAEALAGVDRFGDDEFVGYAVDAAHVAHVRQTMRAWSRELQPSAVLGPEPLPGANVRDERARRPRQSPFTPLGPGSASGSSHPDPGIDL